MTNIKLKILLNVLKESIDQLELGNSNLTDDEMDELIEDISKINGTSKRLSKSYICENILYCDSRTFEYYITIGLIPKGKKEYGFKELSWSKLDLKDAINYRKDKIEKIKNRG